MDDGQVRTFGLAGGGAALVVALGMAFFGGESRQPAPTAAPPPAVSTTVSPTPSVSASVDIPAIDAPSVETAFADGPPAVAVVRPTGKKDAAPQNPNLEFLVRFDERHPLSRAQALWLQGKHADAEALARATIPARPELRGLCFVRFTMGAEIVLANCTPVAWTQVARTSDRWQRKLRGTRGVQYVDANVVVDVENR